MFLSYVRVHITCTRTHERKALYVCGMGWGEFNKSTQPIFTHVAKGMKPKHAGMLWEFVLSVLGSANDRAYMPHVCQLEHEVGAGI